MKTFTKQIIMMCLMTTISHIGLAQCHSWLDLSSPNPLSGKITGAWSVTTDQNNNVYSTGKFAGSISFGSNTLTNPTGGISFYINKFNSDGVVQWAIQLPVTTYLLPPVICQKNGILYVAGAFAGSVGIGSNTITTSRGHYALFVLKLDLNGNIIGYTPKFGGLCNTLAYTLGITVNSLNEIYLTGRTDGNFSFGSILLNNSEGSYAYLAKFSSDLNTIWAIQSTSMADNPNSRGWGITLDNNENVIIGGYFTQEIEFGSFSFNANNSMGGCNPYIAKFDNAGNCQWIRGGQGPFSYPVGQVYSVVSDKSGNIYYSGVIDSTMTIDGNTLNRVNGAFFYCKYTSTGNLVWVHQAGNKTKSYTHATTSLVIDGSNNMWNSGWIDGPASFGGYSLSNGGTYITKLDLDGNFHGVVGSIGMDEDYSSALDSDGNLYVGGSASGDTISFDGNTIININDTSGVDFVLKYCTSKLGIEQISMSDNQVSIYPNPAIDKITVEILCITKESQLSIINSTGQELLTRQISEPKTVIDISTLPRGVYFVRVTNDKTVQMRKIIKQ